MNLIEGDELKARLDRGGDFRLVMVLGERDFRLKHIPGSINVFLPLIKPGTDLLSPDDEVVVYCSGGPCVASTFAYQKLIEIGFQNVWHYAGGLPDWGSRGYPMDGEAAV